jgi:cardiolipin synthase
LFGPLDGRPTRLSKLNTLVQLLFIVAVIGQAGYPLVPQWLVLALGAAVFVTTVISGVDYTAIYVRKAVAVSRARRAAA